MEVFYSFYLGYPPHQLSNPYITGLSLQELVIQQNVREHSIENISSEAGFEQVFKTYFKPLYAYAKTMVRDKDAAEEIVQQVFFRLWEKRDNITIQETIKAYLYRSVFHGSMNYLKHIKVREEYALYIKHEASAENSALQSLETRELKESLTHALSKLPEKCRTVFQLCRFEELKYKEVAEQLNLPVKTVENEMGKALRLLRLSLSDLLSVVLLTFHLL